MMCGVCECVSVRKCVYACLNAQAHKGLPFFALNFYYPTRIEIGQEMLKLQAASVPFRARLRVTCQLDHTMRYAQHTCAPTRAYVLAERECLPPCSRVRRCLQGAVVEAGGVGEGCVCVCVWARINVGAEGGVCVWGWSVDGGACVDVHVLGCWCSLSVRRRLLGGPSGFGAAELV